MHHDRPIRAAIVGDHDPAVGGHALIEAALARAARELAVPLDAEWLPTSALGRLADEELAEYDAVWCGPAGPYECADGALRAIRQARERSIPFLGSCAGFQHAVIEFARNVLGLADADHAESNPRAAQPVIAALVHPLVERTGAVALDPASRTAAVYGRIAVAERYRCRFGLNPDYLRRLHHGGLRVAGVDEAGMATVVELPDHPFFVATLFMPERAVRGGAPHPLVRAFVGCAAHRRALVGARRGRPPAGGTLGGPASAAVRAS